MKIERIQELTPSFLVETDEQDNNGYIRHGLENWTVRLGDCDEPVYPADKLAELEASFLQFISNDETLGGMGFASRPDYEVRIKEAEIKGLNNGIWLAITEIAFYRETQLIENIIQAVGFSYDECIKLMDLSGCNNEIIAPVVEAIFNRETIELEQ